MTSATQSRRMTRTRKDRGFVLCEVLIAIAVFLAAAVFLVPAIVQAFRTARAAEDDFQSALAFEGAIWELDHSDAAAESSASLSGLPFRCEVSESAAWKGFLRQTRFAAAGGRKGRHESLTFSIYRGAP